MFSKAGAILSLAALTVILIESMAEGDVEEAWKIYKIRRREIRKGQFAKAHAMIEEHNKNENGSYTMKHNKFSILTVREKQRRLGAEPPSPPDSRTATIYSASFSTRQILALQVDHRSDPCLRPVKDQGSCGSCWAFATVTPLEFMACRKSNNSVALR